MIQCRCGGIVRQHELTNSREAWSCKQCGRYEVVEKVPAKLGENNACPMAGKKVNE